MRVLIATASRHGSTTEIAHTIAEAITGFGIEVESLPPDDISAVDGFDAVILGSAEYMGRWLEPARDFATRFEGDLAGRPVWLFSSGPIGDPPRPEQPSPDTASIAAQVAARDQRRFSGALFRNRLGLTERAVVRAFRAADGDFRDWELIRTWGAGIGRGLAHGRADTGVPHP